MSLTIIFDADSMNTKLFKGQLTTKEANLIYNDKIYGLNNKDNYGKWDALMPDSDPTERLLFSNELRFYFGINMKHVVTVL